MARFIEALIVASKSTGDSPFTGEEERVIADSKICLDLHNVIAVTVNPEDSDSVYVWTRDLSGSFLVKMPYDKLTTVWQAEIGGDCIDFTTTDSDEEQAGDPPKNYLINERCVICGGKLYFYNGVVRCEGCSSVFECPPD